VFSDGYIDNPRRFMELAVDEMLKSVHEVRTDKISPLVGAVLVKPDGKYEVAHRGECSEGDHAEYTLLERKLTSEVLSGSTLFATLEPCADEARSERKTCCAKRIVKRRISKVWIGIEDPDPLVDGKGIKILQDNGIEVEMFDADLQKEIREANAEFILGAEDRAGQLDSQQDSSKASLLESEVTKATIDDLDKQEIKYYLEKTSKEHPDEKTFMDDFIKMGSKMGFLAKIDKAIHPTGLGLLLFGTSPQKVFPHAMIRATFRTAGKKEDITDFEGSLPKQARESNEWFETVIGRQIDRSNAERQTIFNYPSDVIRETINNALAHRSYDIEGAPIYLEIDDEKIVIRSPGAPVEPIDLERMRTLKVPSLSKNPKIMYVFDKLGLSEQRGLGFETIRKLQTEYKLPLPSIDFDDPYLVFSFPRRYDADVENEQFRELSNAEKKGIDYIRLNSPIVRKKYEQTLGLSQKTAERHLSHFVELGLVKRIDAGPKTHYEIME
jgi:ATP-dependent DNA helicase RecG